MVAVANWPHDTTSASHYRPTLQAAYRLGSAVLARFWDDLDCDGGTQRVPEVGSKPEASAATELAAFADLTGDFAFGEPIRAELRRLDELAALQPNWDSYGAEPISQEALSVAYLLLATTAMQLGFRFGSGVRPYVIVPLASGGVQMEWRGHNSLIEVTIEPDETLGYLLITETQEGRHTEEQEGAPFSALQQLIADVVRG